MQAHYKYQHFALDTSNNIIDVKCIEKTNKQHYFCPYCHQEMIAKCGNVRQWHFAHKSEKCSYDKYLHSIAEIMLVNWFNKASSVTLSMNSYEKCNNYDTCRFHNDEDCKKTKQVEFNLKQYYSKCIKEHPYKGFIADIYCENNAGFDAPIFIEIFVTHECSKEKIDSGVRIIEIPIQKEEDILNIINSSTLVEDVSVRLYNFKRKEEVTNKFYRPFQKFILYPTMKCYIDRNIITCKNYNSIRKGLYEISMPYNDCIPYFINSGGLYVVGKVKAYLAGYLEKDCQLCKWQTEDMLGNKLCKLYKKCGNPKYCNDNNAIACKMFRENSDLIRIATLEWSDSNNFLNSSNDRIVDIWQHHEIVTEMSDSEKSKK